ncbi:MAG: ROK family protein [Ruminococcaceae bacterium]|nr:ROK family protein [Oscillospiraceae bacterium]
MYRLGIDFGGTNIAVGLVDSDMKIIEKKSRPTMRGRDVDLMVIDMAEICNELLESNSLTLNDVESIGIASPGTINSMTGEVESYHAMGMVNYPMKAKLAKALGYDNIKLANDANAAAYGEALAGAAKGASEAIMITLGTGVGGGLILGGKIYEGFNFSAAELGHTVIIKDGEPCPCGRKGCWEQYASATGLIRQTKKAMNDNPKSLLWQVCGGDIEKVNGKTVFDARDLGDEVAQSVIDNYFELLALGLTNMVNIFQPQILCIGGGICGQGEALRKPIEDLVMAEQYAKSTPNKTKIVIAELGNDAGIIGAAML